MQKGTTPTAKLGPDGAATRNFQNFHHPGLQERDFAGPRANLDNRYKLVIDGDRESVKELFDVRSDLAEKNNVIQAHPAITLKLEQQLRAWQQSVLESLTSADYR